MKLSLSLLQFPDFEAVVSVIVQLRYFYSVKIITWVIKVHVWGTRVLTVF